MAKPDWITLSKNSGTGNDTVTVTAAKNTTGAARSGSITVTAGGVTKTVSITQEKIVNSIRGGTSQFMKIKVPYNVFTSADAVELTFQARILLERSAEIVKCEPLKLTRNDRTQEASFGVLDLHSGMVTLADEDYVTAIDVVVYRGGQASGTPCSLIDWTENSGLPNLSFGYYDPLSSATSTATLNSSGQGSIRLSFASNRLLVSGETVIVYKGTNLSMPQIEINGLG